MIMRVIGACARRPRTVLAATLLVAAAGYAAQRSLARDAIPDLSDPQIVLVADWMGHPAIEVTARVTEPITRALDGVPGSVTVRGTSMSGMAYVDVVFGAASALSSGRAEIARRIAALRPSLPPDAVVAVGPEASSTGWVFQYALLPPEKHSMPMGDNTIHGPADALVPLRKFQDEVLRPALAGIPGVAEVASLGGPTDEMVVATTPDQLRGASVAFSDVVSAVRARIAARPNATAGDLEATPLAIPDPSGGAGSVTIPLGRVAEARILPAMQSGIADVDGSVFAVVGIVVAKRDADVGAVIKQVRQVIDSARHRLPQGSKLGVVYDRSELANRVERTLLGAVAEEIVVVALIVLLFLLHGRSALIPMLTLPLVVLLTFAALRLFGVPATVMSLGGIAIALGMAVDADLVAIEACHRRLESDGGRAGDRRRRLIAASGAFAPAILTSLLIAGLAFVPVFAFGGETGRLLRPLALSKTLVIAAAALVALTVAPALRDQLLGGRVVPEMRNPLTRTLVRAYRPFVQFALAHPTVTLTTAALAALSCLPIIPRLGGEFLPRIDEGELLYMPTAPAGARMEDSQRELVQQDRFLGRRPEIEAVYGKIGRADSATDPAPYSMAETILRLRPRAEWPTVARARWYSGWAPPILKRVLGMAWPEQAPMTTAELVESLDRVAQFPGWTNSWTAPVRARMDMMATGVHTPVGVRIVSSDPARLDQLGSAVRAALLDVPGTKSAVYEGLGGETHLTFEPDADRMDRQHADPALVRLTADAITSGGGVGQIEDVAGRLSTPVRVTLAAPWHPEPADELLREATVRAGPPGLSQPVPLALIGRPRFAVAPATLHHERGDLGGTVYVDVRDGTDLDGYVARARGAVEAALAAAGPAKLRAGERIEWTGQYQLLSAGRSRLKVIVPLIALLMLALLFFQFRSWAEALIVLVSVPFALVGSVWTLYLLDYRMSAPVWVGLLSVVGLAMQTGVVMVVYIDDAYRRRMREGRLATRADIIAAHAEGTVRRLRPKVMTIATMGAALLPLLWARGAGAEIMRRVAAPMIGGLITSAFLTLEVIPVLYTLWRTRQLRSALAAGASLDARSPSAPAAAQSTRAQGA